MKNVSNISNDVTKRPPLQIYLLTCRANLNNLIISQVYDSQLIVNFNNWHVQGSKKWCDCSLHFLQDFTVSLLGEIKAEMGSIPGTIYSN